MFSPRRSVLGQAATLPLLWMFAALISAPVIAAIAKGSFVASDGWPLAVSTAGAVTGSLGILITPRSRPPHVRESTIAIGALITSTSLLLYGTPIAEPGLYFSGIILSCLLVISGWGWLGVGIGIVLVALHGIAVLVSSSSASIIDVIDLYSLVVLAIAVAWLRFARRLVRNESAFRSRGRAAIEERRDRERQLAALRMGNALASTGAQRALERVMSSPTIDASLRKESRIAEANLRDHIRCPELEHPLLQHETTAARRRGAEVLLLGTTTSGEHTVIGVDLARALSAALQNCADGDSVTLRQIPKGASSAAVSLLISDRNGAFELREFTSRGEPITTA